MAAKILFGGLPEASNEEAVELFRRAIALEPEIIIHHLELGITYLEMKKKELARAEFETVMRLPVRREADRASRAEAERLLRGIR